MTSVARRAWAHVRSVRPELAALLVLVACQGIAWAIVMPPFQHPDEPDHFVYVDNLARDGGVYVEPRYSDAARTAVVASSSMALAHHTRSRVQVDPDVIAQVDEEVRSRSRTTPWRGEGSYRGGNDDDAGLDERTRAAGYPFLYYAIAAGPVWVRHQVGDEKDVLGDLFVARVASVFLAVLNALVAWIALGRMFGSESARLIGTTLACTLPMGAFLRSGVNADVLVGTLATCVFALAVGVVRRDVGLTWRRSALAGIVVALGLLTKQTFVVLIAAWGLVVLLEVLRRRTKLVRGLGMFALTAGVAGAGAGWFYLGSSSVGAANSVAAVGGDMGVFEYVGWAARERWANIVIEWWGVYGWLDTVVDLTWYRSLQALTAVTLGLFIVRCIIAGVRRRVDPAVIVAFTFVGLWAATLAFVELSLLRSGQSEAFIQGRYYMPMAVPTVALACWGWQLLAGRAVALERFAVTIVLPLAFVYNAVVLMQFVVPRFYL